MVSNLTVPCQSNGDQMALGIAALDSKQFSKAAEHLKKAVKSSETNANAWMALGVAYIGLEKDREAVNALKKAVSFAPTNADCHSFLSYALMRRRDTSASDSARKAIELDPKNAQAHYVLGVMNYRKGSFDLAYEHAKRAISNRPDFAGAYLLSSESLVSSYSLLFGVIQKEPMNRYSLLSEAVENLEKYIAYASNSSLRESQIKYLESLRYFANYFSLPENRKRLGLDKDSQDVDTTPVIITSKPRASYTDEARRHGVTGKVQILVELAASGRVEHFLVLNRLDHGLDEMALQAARSIKFKPAMRNGKPISVVKTFEYGFAIY
jgi:TonB family protein